MRASLLSGQHSGRSALNAQAQQQSPLPLEGRLPSSGCPSNRRQVFGSPLVVCAERSHERGSRHDQQAFYDNAQNAAPAPQHRIASEERGQCRNGAAIVREWWICRNGPFFGIVGSVLAAVPRTIASKSTCALFEQPRKSESVFVTGGRASTRSSTCGANGPSVVERSMKLPSFRPVLFGPGLVTPRLQDPSRHSASMRVR